ncbi:MAG: methyltransferase domain-containing protein [Planctomycetota bacterium]|jgi:SAM-dependent methyltransferase
MSTFDYAGRDFPTQVELRGKQEKEIEKNDEIFYSFKGELYPAYLNKGNAVAFIVDKAKPYCRGKGIDVGAGHWPLPGAIPIQNEEHQNAYKLGNFADSSLDFVFSSHCLEHLDKWQDALKLWIGKLRVKGILFLYLPHKSMRLWKPGGPWVGSNHKWIPSYQVINQFLIGHGMEILEYNPEKDAFWSFHIIAERIK